MTSDGRTTFVWLIGQTDNVGDSALRRAYADALRAAQPIRVWAGDPDSGYVAGLGLRSGELVSSQRSWFGTLLKEALVGRADFAFNSGEYSVTPASVWDLAKLLPVVAILRARGGRVVWMGAAVRRVIRGATWPARLIAKSASPLMWRNHESGTNLGVAGQVMPDWAFSLRAVDPDPDVGCSQRTLVAISLRGDRPYPTADWIEAVTSMAKRCELTPVVVVQVQRDQARASELAQAWGCEVVGWSHDAHDDQERLVRSVYARAALVLSDRLHALILGATEGAAPLGWTSNPSPKVGQHFHVVGLDDIELDGAASVTALRMLESVDLQNRRQALSPTLVGARACIAAASSQLLPRRDPGVRTTRP